MNKPETPSRTSPESMDRWSRNERLYRQLVEMGLHVVPFHALEEQGGIEWLQVAVMPPREGHWPVP